MLKYLPFNWFFWRWNTFDYLPLKHNCSECIRVRGTHSNSLTLMMEGDMQVLYLSVRNLNQIVKINCATKDIICKLEEHGDFRMYEIDGTEVHSVSSCMFPML